MEFKVDDYVYKSVLDKGIIKIPNIRYAISTRYDVPKPFLPPKNAEINSLEKTAVCPQNIIPLLEKMIESPSIDHFDVQESAQFLSVFRPEKIQSDVKLPVVVWIHGGSYEIGCGDVPTSNPSNWVKEQNIIVVGVSYRLGMLGFLGGFDDRKANLGLLDIIEALKWIQQHISGFGGDPNSVTIFGQSSGGDAVAHLLSVDFEKPLFHKAIIQSAPLGLRKGRRKMSMEFSKKTAAIKDTEDPLELASQMIKLKPSVMKFGLKAAMSFGLQYGFFPLAEESEIENCWKKNASKYPILIGFNNEETSFYIKSSDQGKRYFAKGVAKKLLDKTVILTTEKIYGKPALQFAKMYAEANGKAYLYRIKNNFENNPFGGAHCIDLPLVFGDASSWKNVGLLKNVDYEELQKNGQEIRRIWADFAKNGNISLDNIPSILTIKKM